VPHGSSREARFLRAYEEALRVELGGDLTRIQIELVRRCARLALHVEMMDAAAFENGGKMTEHDAKQYLALSNSLARLLFAIGAMPRSPAVGPPTLAEIIGRKAAASAA
jgi:hypothetical protein